MNFYNDNDPKICAWLRELINRKLIPDGVVDSRSIELIQSDELKPYIQCHFFVGIGGWSEALRLAGWPADVPVWTGSCPCQPYSCAGKGKGDDDPRNVWPQFRRLIAACHPPVVFGEQVASKAGRAWLSGVFADLETLAYEVGAADLCAAGVGAPHIRQRLYWIGHSNRTKTHATIHGQFVPGQGCDSFDRNREAVREVEEVETCGLAKSKSQQCDGSRNERGGRGESSNDCRLGNTNHSGPQRRIAKELRECSGEQAAGEGSSPGGVGDSGCKPDESGRGTEDLGSAPNSQQAETWQRQRSRNADSNSSTDSHWSRSNSLPCRDGKSRRVESGTFPLAHGVPARVVRLRGYGNAIVPQVAAEFIGAYLDCLHPRSGK